MSSYSGRWLLITIAETVRRIRKLTPHADVLHYKFEKENQGRGLYVPLKKGDREPLCLGAGGKTPAPDGKEPFCKKSGGGREKHNTNVILLKREREGGKALFDKEKKDWGALFGGRRGTSASIHRG